MQGILRAGCRVLKLGRNPSELRIILEETGGCVRQEIWPSITRSSVWQLHHFILLKPSETWAPRTVKTKEFSESPRLEMDAARTLLFKLDQWGTLPKLTTLAFLTLGPEFLEVRE